MADVETLLDGSEAVALAHPTPEERAARGKAARAVAPRSWHGEWEPASDRRDPVELLEEQAATRVPELVPIRTVQLCGDAHLSNFGGFAAPDRRLVFSINDFDETLPGPFEWDVKRLVASFAVAGRDRAFDARHPVVSRPRQVSDPWFHSSANFMRSG